MGKNGVLFLKQIMGKNYLLLLTLAMFAIPSTYCLAAEENGEEVFADEDLIEGEEGNNDDENADDVVSEFDDENADDVVSEFDDENADDVVSEFDDENADDVVSEFDDENADDVISESGDEDSELGSDPSYTLDTELSAESEGEKDETDSYEQELFDIYQKYYSQPVSGEKWEQIINNQTADVYVVQDKDTLWDISRLLFGAPNYWPKLWSVNFSIQNPHLIRPGNNIGFIQGTEASPPSLRLVQQPGTGSPLAPIKPKGLPKFLKGQKIQVPSSVKKKPVLNNFPSSLPPIKLFSEEEKDEDVKFDFGNIEKSFLSPLGYYMTSDPIFPQGVIKDNKEHGTWASFGQRVIVEMDDPANPGERMTVVKDLGRLNPKKFGVRGPFGHEVEVQGEIKVIGRLESSFDLYEAEVTKSLNPITVGAHVLRGPVAEFNFKKTGITGTGEAQIIGVPVVLGQREQGAPYAFVYLNRGSNNGFSIGQMYQVRANDSVRDTFYYAYDIKVGELKIVHTEDRFSTALVTSMKNPIHIGDYITSLQAQGISQSKDYDPFEDSGDEGDIDDEDEFEIEDTEKEPPPETDDLDFTDFE